MNALELVTRAIREYTNYEGFTLCYDPEEINRIASTLSAGLVVLTEERLAEIIYKAWDEGCYGFSKNGHDYASRIMREVKEGSDG